jgi:hypothetical protein
MTQKEFGENLMASYILLNGAKKHIDMIWEFRKKIDNPQLLETIKQVKPKINFFIKEIETTFSEEISSEKILADTEEKCYEVLEQLEKIIRE